MTRNLLSICLFLSVALATFTPGIVKGPSNETFHVTDFALQVSYQPENGSWYYWLEGHIQLKPKEGYADCWAWQETNASNAIDENIFCATCSDDPSIEFSLTVPSETNGVWSTVYTYVVVWYENHDPPITLEGYYNLNESDFQVADQGNVSILWYDGKRDFDIPVTKLWG